MLNSLLGEDHIEVQHLGVEHAVVAVLNLSVSDSAIHAADVVHSAEVHCTEIWRFVWNKLIELLDMLLNIVWKEITQIIKMKNWSQIYFTEIGPINVVFNYLLCLFVDVMGFLP